MAKRVNYSPINVTIDEANKKDNQTSYDFKEEVKEKLNTITKGISDALNTMKESAETLNSTTINKEGSWTGTAAETWNSKVAEHATSMNNAKEAVDNAASSIDNLVTTYGATDETAADFCPGN